MDTKEDSTVPVMTGDLFKFEMEEYMIMWKSWKIKNDSLGEINGMIYNLVLQHCLKVLESLLKSQTRWDNVAKEMDGVGILLILRDITRKHGSLVYAIVEPWFPPV